MQIDVETIRVARRVRTDVGELTKLAESMKRFGQFSPILVNRKRELIAGYRRLSAAKLLGWHSIEAIVIDEESEARKLEIELEENMQRKQLDMTELSDGFRRLERLQRPSLCGRLARFFRRLFTGRGISRRQ